MVWNYSYFYTRWPPPKWPVTKKASSLFRHFTTITEKANPFLRWWLLPWSILYGCHLRSRWEGEKSSSDPYPMGSWISQLQVRTRRHSMIEGRTIALSLRRESDESRYQPCSQPLNPLQLAEICHEVLRTIFLEWPVSSELRRSSLSLNSVDLLYLQRRCIEQWWRMHCPFDPIWTKGYQPRPAGE